MSGALNTNISSIPQILQQPADVTTVAGGAATFTVFAASTTNLNYQWYEGDWLAIPGATNATLTLTGVNYLDVDTYSVTVTGDNRQSVDSLRATLEIGPSLSFDKLESLFRVLNQSGEAQLAQLRTKGRFAGGFSVLSFSSFPSVAAGEIGQQLINNFNSTTQQGEPIQTNTPGGSSRWYLLTAATNGTLEIDTMGSDIATLLSVYTNYANELFPPLVASDKNDAPDGIHSLVRFSAINGTNYLIQVDGVNGAQGNIYVNWRMGIAPNTVGPAQNLVVTGGPGPQLQAGISNNVTAPTYQWQLNGVIITGATNATYSLAAFNYNQVGSYSVMVSNLIGQVVNAIATVSAQTPLRLTLDTSFSPASFRVTGSATQAMVLQLSTNLSLWTPLYTNPTPLLPISYLDTNSPVRTKGFYRLKSWP